MGGSLGSGTLNKSMKKWISDGCPGGGDIDIIWQCGKYYKEGIDEFMTMTHPSNIYHYDFISRMDLAYAAADVVISRSGASSVSELCAMGKPVVFVPSPNVAEDHQTHNAMALVRKDAAMIVKDADAVQQLLPAAIGLLHDDAKRETLGRNALSMALRDAAQTICDEVYRIL